MAKNSAMPFLLLAGGAAVMMSKKKKKKKSTGHEYGEGAEVDIFGDGTSDQGGSIPTDRPGSEPAGGGAETLTFDETCTQVLGTNGDPIDPKEIYKVVDGQYVALNPLKFNNFITGKFYEGRQQGIEGAEAMAEFVITSQPGLAHCPWGEPEKWTPLMKMTYEDLTHGIDDFAQQQGEWVSE
jgi:hypothetical protein